MGAAVIGGSIAAVGALGSAVIGSSAAQSAANTQASAARNAAQVQMTMFNKTQENLAPWISGGGDALRALMTLTGSGAGGNPLTAPLTKPFAPTMEQLMATPGYQFTLNQGLQATQNAFAAQGLGTSGAAMKGAIGYAEGLASTTYQQQFQNYWSQNQNIYNMLSGISTTGANAGANLGSTSQAVGANIGNNLTSAGAAQAAGIVGSANALSGGLGALGNLGAMYATGMFRPSTPSPGYIDQGTWT